MYFRMNGCMCGAMASLKCLWLVVHVLTVALILMLAVYIKNKSKSYTGSILLKRASTSFTVPQELPSEVVQSKETTTSINSTITSKLLSLRSTTIVPLIPKPSLEKASDVNQSASMQSKSSIVQKKTPEANAFSEYQDVLLKRASTNRTAIDKTYSITFPPKGSSKMLPEVKSFSSFPPEVISGVKLFVLFIGYPRSGHSIIGSLLDAHPNVVMAHEFNVLQWTKKMPNYTKRQLFNMLFLNSYHNAFEEGARTRNYKGYTLTLDNSWQGRYREYVDIIGDKNGDKVSKLFLEDADGFRSLFKKLQDVVSVPIRLIHCVRNPYDIVSTMMLYQLKQSRHEKDLITNLRKASETSTQDKQLYTNDGAQSHWIKHHFDLADSVMRISQSLVNRSTQMLEVHNHELVSSPEETVLKLCQFLEIKCSREFVRTCGNKVFSELSRTRFAIHWSERAKRVMEGRFQKYPFFKRYSYHSEI